MLTLRNACLRRREQTIAFPDLSLQPGEVLGLSGPSGVGKSSLASVLAGMLNVEAEQLTLPKKLAGKANPVQWLIQQSEFAFNPRLSLKDSLFESWRGDGYLPLLEEYGVERAWLARRPNQLSGGQLQRFNLIRALVPTTEYLICDEVTAHLDMVTQSQFWQQLLASAKRRNLGLLVISHDEYLLNAICHRVVMWPHHNKLS
ncbi:MULTISPECIES: ATP-binding cassette domain-containing protein [unclassified Shewanella]|uniref:ATP-binding cassette domain-containing protein n=1 Tax=unclassified Shewanella TaxID=196818 RepID=UPI001BB99CC0|nr:MULTISPECIES: ATP-binding cassette domain-containing protein [unclassified Shewanella]GIU19771.1 peptide ABC transporter [Shewanella sp. MBTL60-112-B1]GIU27811.1 peptide ABC transporter [Shewanella sp. MBTL60-112-B2]